MISPLLVAVLFGVSFAANSKILTTDVTIGTEKYLAGLEEGQFGFVANILPGESTGLPVMHINASFCQNGVKFVNFMKTEDVSEFAKQDEYDIEKFQSFVESSGIYKGYYTQKKDTRSFILSLDRIKQESISLVYACAAPNEEEVRVEGAIYFESDSKALNVFQKIFQVLPADEFMYIINRGEPWGYFVFIVVIYLVVFIIVWVFVVFASAIILCCSHAEYDGCRAFPAALLLYLFPFFGLHHLYMHHCILFIIYILTLGVCGLWAIIDALALRKELNSAFKGSYSSI